MINQHTQLTTLLTEVFGDKPIIGVEIGTALADLPKTLLLAFPNLFIYTVDPYLHDPTSEFEAHLPPEEQLWRKNHATEVMSHFTGKGQLIVATSDDAASLIPDNLDFVWIDGDHRAEQIYKDIINYYPKVKSGGIFGGHDYHRVIPVFRDIIDGLIYLGDDWTWWIRKDDRCLKVQG